WFLARTRPYTRSSCCWISCSCSSVLANRPVSVPADLLSSLSQTAEQALWKREWAARDHGLAVPECVTRRQAVVNQVRILLKNNTHEND
ncbi:DUF1380 family protein, partial [Escherichia coli]|uniref:DUF1380 family protein n=1 Tax=Escherichia coli TaxID=562 RepID=UPI0011135FF0